MISAHLRRKRLANGVLGGLLLLAGASMIAYASVTLVQDVQADIPQRQTFGKVLQARCESAITQSGLSSRATSRGFEVQGQTLDNPLKLLGDASLAIQQCLGYRMTDFCMGTGCEGSAMVFTLVAEGGER